MRVSCRCTGQFVQWGAVVAAALVGSAAASAQTAPVPARSAPLTNLRYEITFDSTTAQTRTIKVAMDFNVSGPGPVLLSFPAWTPGAYELSFFARWVSNFAATAGDQALTWDKLDYDTWRVQAAGAKSVSVHFDYLADTLDNAMAWAQPNFVLFNGTNLLPYPEGRGTDFPATVTVKTEPGWLVATGMAAAPGRRIPARRTTTTSSTSPSSSAGSITTARRWPAPGRDSPPTPPACSRDARDRSSGTRSVT